MIIKGGNNNLRDILVGKGLVIGIVILFVGMSVFPSTANPMEKTFIQSSRGKTLYVGGTGEGNYTKIQDAINDAFDGDTVFVYDRLSPYYELLSIDKPINLIGENRDSTVIDADFKGSAVTIQSDHVTVSGFTLKNCKLGDEWRYNVVHIVDSENVVIKDNKISNGYGEHGVDYNAGVLLESSSNNLIQDNILFTEKERRLSFGVMIHNDANYNNISENEIFGVWFGIGIWSHSGYDNCDDNILYGNYIHNNDVGIEIGDNKNKIINNIVTDNENVGIRIGTNHDNTISGNTVTDNGNGREFDAGIRLSISSNTHVSDNHISNNNPTGIYISGGDPDVGGKSNSISDNDISNNKILGIYITGSYDNAINRNNIIGHKRNAYFEISYPLKHKNTWDNNYWSGHILPGIFPKIIFGIGYFFIFSFPWINIDWNPAKEPYDIP